MQFLKFDLPAIGTSSLIGTWRLQRTFNWQLMMPSSINGILGYLVSNYCQDVKFGDYSIGELSTIRYGALQRFYAGMMEISTVALSFIWPVDNSAYNYFVSWRKLVVDDLGHYRPKNEYKKEIQVLLYDRTGIQSAGFKLKGCFPRTLPRISLSYNDESILRFDVELSVDYIKTETVNGLIGLLASTAIGGVLGSKLPGGIKL